MAIEIVDGKVLRGECVSYNEKHNQYDVTQVANEKRILIVEDNDFKYEELVRIIKKNELTNYVRETTLNMGIRECRKGTQHVDIIILDMQFPIIMQGEIERKAGVEFINTLKFYYGRMKDKKFPQIIGYTSEDFYKMLGDNLPKEFVGQGSNSYMVEQILKELLGV